MEAHRAGDMVIEPKLIDRVWPHVWPLIEHIVVLETEETVLAELRAGLRFLIIVGDGVAVARPCGDIFETNYVGGTKVKEFWPQMSRIIDALAKSVGATKQIAFGTDAWKKLAPDYTPTKTRMYIKEVA